MTITLPIQSVATSLPTVRLILTDRLETAESPASQGATYQLVLFDQNGQRIRWPHESGNAVPHLLVEERQSLLAIITAFRARAEERIIP